ncbi:hypothetical protein Pelo_2518 [Pelomyxa schiedti]|nr:hypothetical protein Pelo_2518 [Pelomyxa schiedti]
MGYTSGQVHNDTRATGKASVAPTWATSGIGLNEYTACPNTACRAQAPGMYAGRVVIQLGKGNFWLWDIVNSLKCPLCSSPVTHQELFVASASWKMTVYGEDNSTTVTHGTVTGPKYTVLHSGEGSTSTRSTSRTSINFEIS